MLFTTIAMTAIVLVASFGLQLGDIAPVYQLSQAQAAGALYVCPAADSVFDSVATGLRYGTRYITMFFFFTLMLLVSSWAWALYQNLLKDKFEDGAFKNVWEFTKIWFWAAVIALLLVQTPNFYRRVTVDGVPGDYVLCESNTPGGVPVPASRVKSN